MRVLARTKTHLEIYSIKGEDESKDIKKRLNKMFAEKGLKFKRVIFTDVKLPNEIATPLDKKAQFKAKNELEKERH